MLLSTNQIHSLVGKVIEKMYPNADNKDTTW